MEKENFQKNVLGEKLETCSDNPVTGWFRDGCCNTDEIDHGVHTVCAKVTTKFLEWAKTAGNWNDESGENPHYGIAEIKISSFEVSSDTTSPLITGPSGVVTSGNAAGISSSSISIDLSLLVSRSSSSSRIRSYNI